jgi:signal peptidase II
MGFYLVVFLIAAFDQAFKYLIEKNLAYHQSLPLIDELVKLTYVRNTGAAFSLFSGFSTYLAIFGLAVVACLIYFHYHVPPKNHLAHFALASILGGSVGNLLDRIFRSYVIDYIDIGVWPAFNLADIMINVGVAILLYKLLVKRGKSVSDFI